MSYTLAIKALLNLVSLKRAVLLLLLMTVTGFSEGLGIVVLVPLLQSLQTENLADSSSFHLLESISALGLPASTSFLMGVILLLIVIRVSLQYCRERISMLTQHQLVDKMRQANFSLLLHTEWRWLTQQNLSDQANSLLTDINRIGSGFNFLLTLLASLMTLFAYLVIAFNLSWQVTSLALLSGAVILMVLSGQRKKALTLGLQLGGANRAMQKTVQQSLAGIKLAKILSRESEFIAQFNATISGLRQQQLDFQKDTSLSKALFQIFGASLLICYLLAGLYLWHVEVAQLLTLVIIFARMLPLFMSAQQQLHHCLHSLPALDDAQKLQALYRQHAEPHRLLQTSMIHINDAIEFKNVTFTYADKEKPSLEDISFRLPVQTTTAVIGSSGAGKSTLADLLMGLLAADKGDILLDKTILTGPLRKQWRQSVAYVPQEVFLFNDTIRNNLIWGNLQASEQELATALKLAAAEFVYALPEQLDTQVGDGGVRLSGGERQRLAMARALLKQPTLLILDEATSALDIDNELRIREAIENIHGNMTIVVIGHRLPTLEHADQVIRLEQGKIVAQGTWQELREQSIES